MTNASRRRIEVSLLAAALAWTVPANSVGDDLPPVSTEAATLASGRMPRESPDGESPAGPPPFVGNAGSQPLSYYHVAGNTMRPRNSANVMVYGGVGCVYLSTTTDLLVAPLNLPDGAVIKGLRLHYLDTSPTAAVRGVLTRFSPPSGFADLVTAPGDVAFAGGRGSSDSPEIQEIVDNSSSMYVVYGIPSVAGVTHQVCGARVAYYPPPEGRFVPISPCRLVDTRGGAPVAGGKFMASEKRTYTLNTIPAACNTVPLPTPSQAVGAPPLHGIKAYALNLTVTEPDGAGFIAAYPTGPPPSPLTSTLNFAAGQTIANAANVPARIDGSIDVVAGASGLHLVIDVVGYYF